MKKHQKRGMTELVLVAIALAFVFAISLFSPTTPTGMMTAIEGAWFGVDDSQYINGSALISNTNGSYLTYRFNGSKLFVVTQKRDDFGIMDVVVDGVTFDYDLYNGETEYKVVKEIPAFGGWEHEAIIKVTGRKNNDSLGTYILIDELLVDNLTTPTETAPLTELPINTTIQLPGEINKPVVWKKIINVSDELIVELPSAENITVKKIVGEIKEEVSEKDIQRVQDNDTYLIQTKLTEPENITLIINDSALYEITYQTPPPQITETNISTTQKEITVSSDLHYENITTYTTLPVESSETSVKLYHIVNDTKVLFPGDIIYLDENRNGLIDKLQWVIPHLSNQTFLIEITILNVFSFPRAGQNWTVSFNTTGTANLTVTPVNDTLWDREISFVELKCGGEKLFPVYNNIAVFQQDYSCNTTATFTSFVHIAGKAALEFRFGDAVAYAYDPADFIYNMTEFDYNWSRVDPVTRPAGIAYLSDGGNGQSLVYDSANKITILFGAREPIGITSTINGTNATWYFNSSINEWSTASVNIAPTERRSPTMVYDSINNITVLFAGQQNNNNDMNDTWIFNYTASAWRNATPTGTLPAAGASRAAAFDRNNQSVLLFVGTTLESRLYSYRADTNIWRQLAPTNMPSARRFSTFVYDESANLTVLYGGYTGSGSTTTNETWVYNSTDNTFSLRPVNAQLYGARHHSMTYDPEKKFLIILMGETDFDGTGVNQTFAYNTSSNSWINLSGKISHRRSGQHTLMYDREYNQTIRFGSGGAGGAIDNETWFLNLTLQEYKFSENIINYTWYPVSPDSRPRGIANHSSGGHHQNLVYDASIRLNIFFGEIDEKLSSGATNATWGFNATIGNWTIRNLSNAPTPRRSPLMVYDSVNNVTVLFGGEVNGSTSTRLNDTWIYNFSAFNLTARLAVETWTNVTPASLSPPITNAATTGNLYSIAFDRQNTSVLLFGGDRTAGDNRTFMYSVSTNAWRELSPTRIPAARADAAMAHDDRDNATIIFGGNLAFANYTNETWVIATTNQTRDSATINAWTLRLIPKTVPALARHGMVFDATRRIMIIFGGQFYDGRPNNHTYGYNVSTNEWLNLTVASFSPDPKTQPAMSFDRSVSDTILFGGTRGIILNDTWRLNVSVVDLSIRFGEVIGIDYNWTLINPETRPAGIAYVSGGGNSQNLVYDSPNKIFVLFGAREPIDITSTVNGTNATWYFNSSINEWSTASVNIAPTERRSPTMVYDSINNVTVLFAGQQNNNNDMNDTWIFNYSAAIPWRNATPTGTLPAAGVGRTATFDKNNLSVLLFVGTGAGNRLYSYRTDTNVWRQLAPANMPSAKTHAYLVYDESANLSVLFGGLLGTTGTPVNETWVYNVTNNRWSPRRVPDTLHGFRHHAMVYDPIRKLVITFGGESNDELSSNQTYAYNTTTNTWLNLTPRVSPGKRLQHAIAFDRQINATFIFGAGGASPEKWMNETWVLNTTVPTITFKDIANFGFNWSLINIGATRPRGITNFSVGGHNQNFAYDSKYKAGILFGEVDEKLNAGSTNRTWIYNVTTRSWALLSIATAPTARRSPLMAYDSVNNVTVLFGGEENSTSRPLNDTWIFNFSAMTWTNVTSSVVPETPGNNTGGHLYGIAFDRRNGSVVLFGGGRASGDNRLYMYNVPTNTWRQLAPTLSPSPRTDPTLVFDEGANVTVLFGGSINGTGTPTNETWIYDSLGPGAPNRSGNRWEIVPVPDELPGIMRHSVAYDPERKISIIFGGLQAGGRVTNHTYAFNASNRGWTNITPELLPDAIQQGAAMFDRISNRTILFGGTIGSRYTNNTWELNVSVPPEIEIGSSGIDYLWILLTPDARPRGNTFLAVPSGSAKQNMVYDIAHRVSIFFGARDDNTPFGATNDTWIFNASTLNWSIRSVNIAPQHRKAPIMAYDSINNVTVLFGGESNGTTSVNRTGFNDTWIYNFSSNEWRNVTPSLIPNTSSLSSGQIYAMAFDRNNQSILLFGGGTTINLMFSYRTDTNTWRQLKPVNQPSERVDHAMVYDESANLTILFGGRQSDTGDGFNETIVYNSANNRWTKRKIPKIIPGLYRHSMMYNSQKQLVFIFGGSGASATAMDHLYAYNTTGDIWYNQTVTRLTKPGGRSEAVMIFDRATNQTVMFGGRGNADVSGGNNETWILNETNLNEPGWADNVTNFTALGLNQSGMFNVTWVDDIGMSSYIFSIGNGIDFENDTAVKFSGRRNVSSTVKRLNISRGNFYTWRVYANNTRAQWNVTPQFLAISNAQPGGGIPTQSFEAGVEKQLILTNFFSDPDGDTLSFSATTTGLITATLSGNLLTLFSAGPATDTVTVTVSDGEAQGSVTITSRFTAIAGGGSPNQIGGPSGGGGAAAAAGEGEGAGAEAATAAAAATQAVAVVAVQPVPAIASISVTGAPGGFVNISQIVRLQQVAVTASNFTNFTTILGLEPIANFSNMTLDLGYVCAGSRYKIFKCDNWNFTYGYCNNDTQWRVFQDIPKGLILVNVTLEPKDPGLGIGPSPYATYCGDNSCDNGETCSNCEFDCGKCPEATIVKKEKGIFDIFTGETTLTGAAVACQENWTCTEWGLYNATGQHMRQCSDANICGTISAKPFEIETCRYYVPEVKIVELKPVVVERPATKIIRELILLLVIAAVLVGGYYAYRHYLTRPPSFKWPSLRAGDQYRKCKYKAYSIYLRFIKQYQKRRQRLSQRYEKRTADVHLKIVAISEHVHLVQKNAIETMVWWMKKGYDVITHSIVTLITYPVVLWRATSHSMHEVMDRTNAYGHALLQCVGGTYAWMRNRVVYWWEIVVITTRENIKNQYKTCTYSVYSTCLRFIKRYQKRKQRLSQRYEKRTADVHLKIVAISEHVHLVQKNAIETMVWWIKRGYNSITHSLVMLCIMSKNYVVIWNRYFITYSLVLWRATSNALYEIEKRTNVYGHALLQYVWRACIWMGKIGTYCWEITLVNTRKKMMYEWKIIVATRKMSRELKHALLQSIHEGKEIIYREQFSQKELDVYYDAVKRIARKTEQHLATAIKKGQHPTVLRNLLIKEEWPQERIEKRIRPYEQRYAQAKEWVTHTIKQGYPVKLVKNALSKKGWAPRAIRDFVKPYEKIDECISLHLKKALEMDYLPEQIIKAYLEKEWSTKYIKKILEKEETSLKRTIETLWVLVIQGKNENKCKNILQDKISKSFIEKKYAEIEKVVASTIQNGVMNIIRGLPLAIDAVPPSIVLYMVKRINQEYVGVQEKIADGVKKKMPLKNLEKELQEQWSWNIVEGLLKPYWKKEEEDIEAALLLAARLGQINQVYAQPHWSKNTFERLHKTYAGWVRKTGEYVAQAIRDGISEEQIKKVLEQELWSPAAITHFMLPHVGTQKTITHEIKEAVQHGEDEENQVGMYTKKGWSEVYIRQITSEQNETLNTILLWAWQTVLGEKKELAVDIDRKFATEMLVKIEKQKEYWNKIGPIQLLRGTTQTILARVMGKEKVPPEIVPKLIELCVIAKNKLEIKIRAECTKGTSLEEIEKELKKEWPNDVVEILLTPPYKEQENILQRISTYRKERFSDQDIAHILITEGYARELVLTLLKQ